MTSGQPSFRDALAKGRKAWVEALGEHTDQWGSCVTFEHVPQLQEKHTKGCQLLPSRNYILDFMPKNAVCAEIGTWKGDFAEIILKRALPKELQIFDLTFTRFSNHERFKNELAEGKVIFNEGDSSSLLGKFPENYFDWIYIDAGHEYEDVKKDINAAYKVLKKDGWLIFNDYIYWSHKQAHKYGVIEAVNEFLIEHDWKLELFALHPQMYCDVACRKI